MSALDKYKDILDEKNVAHLRTLLGDSLVDDFYRYLATVEVGYGFPPMDLYKNFEMIQNHLKFMASFGDNRWWEHDADPRRKAYFQFYSAYQLISIDDFMSSLETLIGRQVDSSELIENQEILAKAVSTAFNAPFRRPPQWRVFVTNQ